MPPAVCTLSVILAFVALTPSLALSLTLSLALDKVHRCTFGFPTNYGDFLVDSGKLSKIDRLNNLHKRAMKLIDNKAHRDQDIAQLMSTYGLESLLKRREKHHLSLMYRLKDDKDLIEQFRANIELRNNSKIKFKTRTTKLTKVANSPYYRGVWLWDRLNESTQKATTKVKFKQLIA